MKKNKWNAQTGPEHQQFPYNGGNELTKKMDRKNKGKCNKGKS